MWIRLIIRGWFMIQKIKIKQGGIFLLGLCALSVALADPATSKTVAPSTPASLPKAQVSGQSLDTIVAIVNSDIITASELNSQIAMVKQQMQGSQTPLPSDDKIKKQVLDQLIYKKLQLQVAKRAGVTVT